VQEIDPFEMADLINDDRAIEEALELTKEQAIIAQNADPAVVTSWENEIINLSPRRAKDDGDPPIII
jgi:hypothetical protein